MQYFKPTEELEQRLANIALPSLVQLGDARDQFYAEAFVCYLLGDVLYDLGRDPMSGVITRGVFRSSFFAVHDLFTRPGTFEYYLEVFRAVFGSDVNVLFEVPNPGHLRINIQVLDYTTFNLLARRVENNQYVYYPLVTSDAGDFIMGQGPQGIRTEDEIRALISEISPNGIFIEVNLTL